VKDFVELLGTSEELATGMSILFTVAGAVDLVGVAEGVGVGIVFPESHARTVLPFDFVLIQV